MDHGVITTFIFASVTLVTLATGFLLKAWANTVMQTMATLTEDVITLTALVAKLKSDHDMLDLRHQYQAKEIAALAARSCGHHDCPYKQLHIRHDDLTNPGFNGVLANG